VAATLS